MPRQLPWKVGTHATKQAPSRPKASASPAPSSASRSPAPSHRPTPVPKREETPEDRFMIEGIDHDDMYRMVEDEFLAVAGEFTRHLHTAEYQRLKGLAKSQNAETIQNISRPVTQEMTDLVKRRHAALDTAARQRKGIAKTLRKRAASIDSDEEEPSRRPATSLQGLMDSPRKQNVPLTSIIGTRPGSSYRRAADASPCSHQHPGNHAVPSMKPEKRVTMAGGTHRGPSLEPSKYEISTESDEGNDLDGQPPWPQRQSLQRPEPGNGVTEGPPVPRQTSWYSNQSNPFLAASKTQLPRYQSPTNDASTSEHVATPNDDDEDDDPLARLRARRAEQKRRRMNNKAQDDNTKISDSQAAAIDSIPFT
ncbi:hypothetical protein MYCTH_97480 [Thermothelomyces thermophilus ATCC 42464]|uniref:Uncharacterized protein n=1 Tax=Thermothelomyces thermophilus (strain ATCC 42464 / BCRC 31852 / DSM 1799) TaxID=573729 RepID=G2Q656_THET4|nr:uncharacterized protein MYCTH_97480 [Thermothelomyces thermophilus ATCC 42464]AEO55535.1 hypothetical protein MYCTH_97480 [Thermothelomyces thermophilus ATCC 42464]